MLSDDETEFVAEARRQQERIREATSMKLSLITEVPENLTQLVTLCWSSVVARGGGGTAREVHDELALRGKHVLSVLGIESELARLRRSGALP